MSPGFPVVKPAFAENNIPVILSTDENYLPYVQVVVNSIKAHSKIGNLDILILHDGISVEKTETTLKRYADSDRISVRFIDVGAHSDVSVLSGFKKLGRLPISALYRLFAPSVMLEYSKAVYLDIDTLVCRDIADLYASDLGDCLFASTLDMVQIIKPEYIAWARSYGFTEWDSYINSGVMVMNLERLRNDAVVDKLLPVALDAARWACDQDAFNFVCKGRIKILDPRWNVQVGDYCIAKQLAITKDEGWIYHFTEAPKPWDRPEHLFANYWWAHEDVDSGMEQWRKIYGSKDNRVIGEDIAVSVIIPVVDSAAYLPMMLISLAAQTLRNIEIICVDAGSVDGSFNICQRFASLDKRFRIFSQSPTSIAGARNRGMAEANGNWLFFADSKDFCKPEMLAEMVCADEKWNHDIIVTGRTLIDCEHQGFLRIENVPEPLLNHKGTINCHADVLNIFLGSGFVLWNKLFKAEFVRRQKLMFHSIPLCEDMYFIFASLLAADSIAFVGNSFYFHRTTPPDCQTDFVDKHPPYFAVALREVKELFENENYSLREQFCSAAIVIIFDIVFSRRTPEVRRAAFGTLQNGEIDSIVFPDVDMDVLDMGKYNRIYGLTKNGADFADVLSEYYTTVLDVFLSLCGESQKRLRRLDSICNSLSKKIDDLRTANDGKTQVEELKKTNNSLSFQVNRLRTIFMELARMGK